VGEVLVMSRRRESGTAAALAGQDRAGKGHSDQCGNSEQNGEYNHEDFLLDFFDARQ
jgi:hypothetical protein